MQELARSKVLAILEAPLANEGCGDYADYVAKCRWK